MTSAPALIKDPNEASTQAAPRVSTNRATGEHLYLLGRPTLKLFLQYVNDHALAPPDEGKLIEAWQKAESLLSELRLSESGAADDPGIINLGPEYEPLVEALLRDPLMHQGFGAVPTEVALVPLDQLVVHQERIDLSFAGDLECRIGPAPSREALFRTCLPFDHPQPPANWTRHYDKFTFVSPSNDLRFLGPMPLKAEHITGVAHPGCPVGIVGLAVGFGANYLNAIACEGRLILDNGSHRAYALRRMGITHVPCVIQHVSSREELAVVASAVVRDDPDRFLKDPRPPLLKDYLDPRLYMVMAVQRRLRQVTVRFAIEEEYIPAL